MKYQLFFWLDNWWIIEERRISIRCSSIYQRHMIGSRGGAFGWFLRRQKRLSSMWCNQGHVWGLNESCDGSLSYFSIIIGLHQGLSLSPYLFVLVMDDLTKDFLNKVPWCMLFADYIVLVDEIRKSVDVKLELWTSTLEFKDHRLSWSKTENVTPPFWNRERGGHVQQTSEWITPIIINNFHKSNHNKY